MKIGFLFNHDASHQVPHTIPIAAALAARGIDIEILTSSEEQDAVARALMPPDAAVYFRRLKIGAASRAADRVLRHVAPFKRIAILRENLGLFKQFDALVVPETTSTLLKTRFGVTGPKLIYLPHGAGDGAAGFQHATKSFDFVLLPGRKVRDRMLAAGLVTETNHAIVGYPKFDRIGLGPPVRFFDNDRPTVLYNPHFNPWLSSWYSVGRRVLDWFAAQDRFNLIFAPHVMLFRRLIHTSLIHRRVRLRPHLPRRFRNRTGILIDVGSRRSIDMTYVQSADIYLGDVSSQIYEWIQRPRPAIFFNTHKPDWRDAPDYRHWAIGEVIDGSAALPAALDRAVAHPDAFSVVQSAAAQETFSITDRPAGERAADAILAFLQTAGRPKL
jgi:hypothetical protein